MSEPGRARGRGRGRGRSRGATPQEARRPGEPAVTPATSSEQPHVGRGRGRAVGAAQQQQRSEPPTQQMQQMKVRNGDEREGGRKGDRDGEGGRRGERDGGGRRSERDGDGGKRGEEGRRALAWLEPHTRPEHIQDKTGGSGQTIDVMSNFVVLRSRPDCAIYQYNVSYNPQMESKRLRIGLLMEHEASLIGKVRAFDGMILYLPHRLPQDVTTVVSKTKQDQTTVNITITLTNELHASSPICIQLFNILFRRILAKLDMQLIGRHYYSPSMPAKIPQHKLELWPGFITSILQYEKNVMLCADISHKILRTDTVWDYLNDLHSRARNFHEQATRALVGEIVLTRYNNKTYRIDDIDWNKNPRSVFSTPSGNITFVQYYRRAYEIDIQDQAQPLLVSQPKKRDVRARGGDDSPILLIPELCTRTGLSDETREDFRVMKDIAVYTRITPDKRHDTLMKFVNRINTTPGVKEILEGWNVKFDDKLHKFKARVMPSEKIYQQNTSYNYKPSDADWSREMRGNRLISTVNLHTFMVVSTGRDMGVAQDFVQTLQRVGTPMGLQVGEPAMFKAPDDRTDTFLKIIVGNLTGDTQMVIIILPTNRKDRYDAVKKLCCVDHPVPSQCLLSRTLGKKQMLMSVTTKVALQLNCKLGGELWAVEIPLKNNMVIGIDTYHDSATRGQSVGGFIASTNATFTRYYTQCMFQHTGQELLDNLKVCMTAALRKYHEINGKLPDRIIVYRDGVGDGQLPAVVDHEVPQMIQCFKEAGGANYTPKFAVIVVKKRINTRVFHDFRGQLQNPPPGTVVDSEVTRPEWYDFFLVSQSVRQGTVTPTHFNVITDTTGLKPDHMQRLTYKLCHLYYNWPGTVRVPAPCQYAHKLAFLVGQSIHKKPAEALSDRLYFL